MSIISLCYERFVKKYLEKHKCALIISCYYIIWISYKKLTVSFLRSQFQNDLRLYLLFNSVIKLNKPTEISISGSCAKTNSIHNFFYIYMVAANVHNQIVTRCKHKFILNLFETTREKKVTLSLTSSKLKLILLKN